MADIYESILAAVKGIAQSVSSGFGGISAWLQDIHAAVVALKPKKGREISLTYPLGGGTKLFAAGTTMVDFFNGRVIFPDGTEEKIYRNLKEHNQTHVSAIYIKSDTEIKVNFDNSGEYTIRDYLMEVHDFQVLYITTTQSTAISLKAWTNDKSYLATAKLGTGTASRVFMRTESSQVLSAGALSVTSSSSNKRWKLIEVLLHASTNITETVTVTFNSITGSNYDTTLGSASLSAKDNFQFHPDSEIVGLAGDEITVTCTNANATGTVYTTIVLEEI